MTEGDNYCQSSSNSVYIQHSGAAVDMETEAASTAETQDASADPTKSTVTKESICEYLSRNPKIYFKSQQIDDPDLTNNEKQSIALNIYNSNQRNFLMRFGKFLQQEHLNHFEENALLDDDEINLLIRDLTNSLRTHDRDVKNRRYVAMQELIKAGNYFSECEMMKREPHLYEEMVGQYLTNTEKLIRDRTGEECTPFSSILLDNYDKDEMEKLRKRQQQEEGQDDSDEETNMSVKTGESHCMSQSTENDKLYPQVPASQRKLWGGFEDDVQVTENSNAMQTVQKKTRKPEERFITAGEREMLRQEFVGIMYEKFLEGKDKEFDYDSVDNNADLDDLHQIGQDSEDKYFEDDDDDVNDEVIGRPPEKDEHEDSDDELDIYMEHLNKNPTLTSTVDE